MEQESGDNSAAGSTPSGAGGGDAHSGLGRAVRTVSGLTLVSRFAGLARDVVTARLFGDDALGSAFRAAYALPNLFRRLFGEGALSAAFLPTYVILRRDEEARADELATVVVRALTLVTSVLTLAAMGVLVLLLAVLPADEERSLSFKLMLLMLPMMPAVCLTAILGGVLQAVGRFGPPAAAPIVLNVFQIGAGLVFYAGLMADRVMAAYLVGAAAVVASLVQIVWSLWALRGRVKWGAAAGAAREHARAVFDKFLPATVGLGAVQLNSVMDMVIAMWPLWVGPTVLGVAVPLDAKSNAVLSYTQTIYQFPLGVFGIAVATAVFPMLSRAADRGEEFAGVLRRGLRLSLFIGLPATLGLIVVRHDLVAVIFGGGGRHSFTPEGVARCADALLGFSVGVWAYSLNHVYTRAFYARGDTGTPMRVAVGSVLLNLALNLTLIWPLREAGMAWATGIAATVQCAVLGWLCQTRLGVRSLDRGTLTGMARITALSLLMAAGVWVAGWIGPPAAGWGAHLLRLCVGVACGVVVFGAGAVMLRLPELRWLLARGGGPAGPVSME
ncbi:MAG: murein biosynthesis integral membrane protein MurJ [Leptolyngbya sp. PLA1]|nr:murein biosynthesis integral membrane protein MurJ [Leptolyngbya sp. PLA1]